MIYIIGAGLAGLAAGYELTKAGKPVTILEANHYPGGRVRSLEVDGHMVDFGGFIVYPWYTEYHRLTKALGLHSTFTDMPSAPVYYELTQGVYTKHSDVSIPIRDMARVYALAAPKLLLHRPQINDPALDAFGDMTISEFLKKALKREEKSLYETFADIVCQGYCYGPVDEYRMSVVAPIVLNTTFRGDLQDSVSFAGNNEMFPRALADFITKHGGEITYGEQVTSISNGIITTDKTTYKADTIIYAGRYDQPFIPALLHTNAPTRYTNFYNVVIEFDSVPELETIEKWGALFYLPDESEPYQILSAVNIHELTNTAIDERLVNFNIIARTDKKNDLNPNQLLNALQENVKTLFPKNTPVGITHSIHWDAAMPVASTHFIQAIRDAQGTHGIWYAGDILGSPSMETALRTGTRAAQQILDYHDQY